MNVHNVSQYPLMTIEIPMFQYPDIRKFALQKIRFNIHPQDSIAILGESGSGKSTLLKILAGLLRIQSVDQVCMLSADRGLVPLKKIPRKILYGRLQIVFQDNMGSLYEKETVKSSLKHIARIKKQKKQAVFHCAKKFFQQLRLIACDDENAPHLDSFESFMKKQVAQLSMGMLRRYCLAKALLLLDIYDSCQTEAPKILLVDEISRGLDNATKKQLVQFLKDMQKTYHLAIVAISHELDFLKAFCQQFYFLFEGFQIPKSYSLAELDEKATHNIKNIYLRRYFIPCEEPIRLSNLTEIPQNACYFQQFYNCPEASRCKNFNKKEYPWICY